jgi:hypothetical protein
MDGIGEDELWSAVVDGLRKNTAYRVSLTHTGDFSWPSEAPSRVKALIGFYLKLNRNGRKFLQTSLSSRIPLALWPRILANMSSTDDASLLFYFLQKKPQLVQC